MRCGASTGTMDPDPAQKNFAEWRNSIRSRCNCAMRVLAAFDTSGRGCR
jgi:hypothetical protein